ncbi:hypothetical protein NDU88_004291 [Pleurodeles waltl]|uniref:Uncharacterized protein n=1 Tax=Pleurodeles waltl TaxID=8319 RepID=A0AAV7QCI9_PLEWA|nr:hypothetical protein NDU88_004291 [Pleurodeles waltl]
MQDRVERFIMLAGYKEHRGGGFESGLGVLEGATNTAAHGAPGISMTLCCWDQHILEVTCTSAGVRLEPPLACGDVPQEARYHLLFWEALSQDHVAPQPPGNQLRWFQAAHKVCTKPLLCLACCPVSEGFPVLMLAVRDERRTTTGVIVGPSVEGPH